MFGRDSLPSCIYSYDIINTKNINLSNLSYLEESLWKCNIYRNKIIEMRQNKTNEFCLKRAELFPKIKELEDNITNINNQVNDVYIDIKQSNIKDKQRKTGTIEQQNTVKELKSNRKKLQNELKIEKEKVKSNEIMKVAIVDIEVKYNIIKKQIRKQYSKEIYSGFRGQVENSIKGAFPNFKKFKNEGILDWQLAKNKHKLTWERASSGLDARIKIRSEYFNPPRYKKGIKQCYYIATLTAHKNNIDIPFYMHRPLPDNVEIKHVYLKKEIIGTTSQWKIQFVISRVEGFKKEINGYSSAGIDINWTKQENGISVALVDGIKKYYELILPSKLVNKHKKIRELQSIVKDDFNKALADLVAFGKVEAELLSIKLPEWLCEKLKYADKWKSPKHLNKLTRFWTTNRFIGDEEIFNKLKYWIKRYTHLYNWQVRQYKKFVISRDNLYKTFVSEISDYFNKLYIEKLNLKEMKKQADTMKDDKSATRVYRDIVAPGRLIKIMKEKLPFIEVNAAYTSKKCHKCKEITKLSSEQDYTCEYCKETWNRQFNASVNLYEKGEQQCAKLEELLQI